jgi:hypothetical protein
MTLKDKLLALKLIKEFGEGRSALFKDGPSLIITIPAFQNITTSIPTISFDVRIREPVQFAGSVGCS